MTNTDLRSSTRTPPATSRGLRGLMSDLALGARLAVGGGRASWIRLGLMAFALGACVVLLLIAASVGPATAARQSRVAAIEPASPFGPGAGGADGAGPPVLEVHQERLNSGSHVALGLSVAALSPHADPPPGVARLPGPGQLVLSPALSRLLASDAGAGLRPRLAGTVIGSIGDSGLPAPSSLLFYRGIAPTPGRGLDGSYALGWGAAPRPDYQDDVSNDVDTLVLVTGTTVLIVPLLVFISIASRIGGPARIRRLAAIRLIGASAAQLRRLAIAESLVATGAGMVLGAAGFLLVRAFAGSLSFAGAGFFPSDVTPDPVLTVLTVVLVPLLGAVSVLAGHRRAAVEPLGLARSGSSAPRKLWWRIGIAATAGAVLLFGGSDPIIVALGVTMAMICIPVFVPYLAERLARRLPTGGVAWQLAVRGLRADGTGTAARAVAGIAVVLCAAVALLPLLSYVGARVGENTESSAPARDGTGVLFIDRQSIAALPAVQRAVSGAVRSEWVTTSTILSTTDTAISRGQVQVAPCAAIQQVSTLDNCRPGDVVQVVDDRDPVPPPSAGGILEVQIPAYDPNAAPVNIPIALPTVIKSATRTVFGYSALYLTPEALHGALDGYPGRIDIWMSTVGLDDAAFDRARNALAEYGWRADDSQFGVAGSLTRLGQLMATVRTGLVVGGGLILLVAVLSMILLAVEQLTERRRALTMAVASGVPRSVLARSSLLRLLIPAAVSVVVADLVGIGITMALNPLLRADLRLDPVGLLGLSVATLALVALITAATLPAMRRLTRPEDLRTE